VRENQVGIQDIARRLARPIPRPRVKPPRVQKSWMGLSVGQRLRTGPGNVFVVVAVDSAGMNLEGEDGTVVRWTDKEWSATFEKAGRRK